MDLFENCLKSCGNYKGRMKATFITDRFSVPRNGLEPLRPLLATGF